jgi:2-methylisocitrate lyase-like PEP mutase family enzyme
MSKPSLAIARFRELHESGCFVLPNPWDAGSAIYLERLGFKALATTSAGFAFSKALPDGPAYVSREMMLDHFREIAAATNLPVNADFQNGYADEPEGVAESVRLCVASGVAGLSIEDSTGNNAKPLYDFDLAVERIKAARTAIDSVSEPGAGRGPRAGSPRGVEDATGSSEPVVLTARCEAYLVGDSNPLRTSLDRLVAFAEADADCLYAPGVTAIDEIEQIVKAVAPKPVNILVSTNNCNVSVSQLADLGVRRISVGGALARAAWGGFIRAAREIHEQGSFTSFAEATPFGDLTSIFMNRG